MTKMRIMSVMTALALAIALFTAVASAALTGAMTIFGAVTIDGKAAPAGTTVALSVDGGKTTLPTGSAKTGAISGQAANEYRIDLQVDSSWEGVTATIWVNGAATPATVVIKTNTPAKVDVAMVAGPAPTPTPTATAGPVDPSWSRP